MKILFKHILLISVVTTLTALIASILALPDNSGYAGLFFTSISPIFIFIFIIWTLILSYVMSRKAIFRNLIALFLATFIFEYLVIAVTAWMMSSDNPDYYLNDFLSDCADIFCDKAILFCTLGVAAVYALLLKYFVNINKKQQSPEAKGST